MSTYVLDLRTSVSEARSMSNDKLLFHVGPSLYSASSGLSILGSVVLSL